MKIYNLAILLILIAFSLDGCNTKDTPVHSSSQSKTRTRKISKIQSPAKNEVFTLGDPVSVAVSFEDSVQLDSAEVYFKGQLLGNFKGKETFTIDTEGAMPGSAGVRVKLFFSNGMSETDSERIILNSDVTPTLYRYRIVNTYEHDRGAYTQGLQYYEGFLYEGTGYENQSTVRKVRLEDGEVLQIRNNASEIFGEGITIYNGRIYQLTYKAQVCFIYDLNSLEEIQKVYYQNKEGWGLTNNGEELIMSDGTHVLYFLDPEMFTVNRQVEVYDHEGAVKDLNELEYIKGKIYANRYYSDEIVIIDPENGKVEGRIDLKGILPVSERRQSTNVLNGIAWDEDNDRLFVTGKYWPKLYEIDIQPILTD